MNDGPSPIGPSHIKQIVKEHRVFNQKNTELKNIKYLISNQNLVFRFVELICCFVRFLSGFSLLNLTLTKSHKGVQ